MTIAVTYKPPMDIADQDCPSTGSVLCRFLSEVDLDRRIATASLHVLGLIRFGHPPDSQESTLYPSFTLPLTPLFEPSKAEVWATGDPVEYGQVGNVRFGMSKHVMFGGLYLNQCDFASLETATHRAYAMALGAMRQHGYDFPLRMWNFFPHINEGAGNQERYQRFCSGRYQAFAEHGFAFDGDLPAASAIGVEGDGIWIYFLAGRKPGLNIENPRQVSAFRYPPQYGPRSPSFSRATLAQFAHQRQLYLSGTASIVGHASLHHGDPEAQLAETLDNVEAILQHPDLKKDSPLRQFAENSWLKIYIRHSENAERIRALLNLRLGTSCPVMFLQGDICRSDLLLEIEGVLDLHV